MRLSHLGNLLFFFRRHSRAFALVAAGFGLWVFAELADEVMEGETRRVDETVLLAMRVAGDPADPVGPSWLEEMFRDFTALGSTAVLVLVTLSSAGYLKLRGRPRLAWLLVLAVLGAVALSHGLKAGFDRPRPDLISHGAVVHTASFPSGHSLLSATVFLTCGSLLAAAHRSRRLQAYILGWAVFLATLVGLSRIYLGVHWPTDVVAGWAVGTAWAATWWLGAQWLEERGSGGEGGAPEIDIPRRRDPESPGEDSG